MVAANSDASTVHQTPHLFPTVCLHDNNNGAAFIIMVGKKSSRGIPSKISSITAPATSSTTNTSSKSSVLQCLFPPANFQLALFASVIQGFDAQHVRIHDTVTGRLRCDHAIKSTATVTCLDWGCHGKNFEHGHAREQRKKRKRTEQANGDQSGFGGDVLLAFGTSDSEISLLSAAEPKIVGILQGEHVQGIKDFKFTDGEKYVEGWSLGGDGKLVQWDIRKRSKIR